MWSTSPGYLSGLPTYQDFGVSAIKITINPSMHDETVKCDRFDWRFPFYAAIGALILLVPIMIYGNDVGEIAYILVAAPIISLVILIVALRKKKLRRLAVLSMLVAYWAVSMGLVRKLS